MINPKCPKLIFKRKRLHILYALLVYFSTPYLSILGGIAIALYAFPPKYFGEIYALMFRAVPSELLALTFGISSLTAWCAAMVIGPQSCGIALPTVKCFSKLQAKIYIFSLCLLWVSFVALSTYSWFSLNPLEGLTFGLLAVSILIRIAIIATKFIRGYG